MTDANNGLVAPSDIAEMADVSRGAVSNWRKRAEDFPAPVGGTPAKPLFSREAVTAWLTGRGYTVKRDDNLRVWSALNSLRGATQPQDMVDIVLSLACAKHLSEATEWSHSPWSQVCEEVARDGFTALLEAAPDTDRWTELVHVPEQMLGVAPAAASAVVNAVDSVPLEDLAAVTDFVLNRITNAQIRAGLEWGFVGSRISETVAILAVSAQPATLYDPACGMGSAITSVLDAGCIPDRVVGHDLNRHALRQAAQRCYLRGVDLELEQADILQVDPDPELRADVVIAEPPFGIRPAAELDLVDPRWRFGVPVRSSMETAWLQHAVAHLTDGGRAFVVTPMGTLFRGHDKRIRTELVRQGCVEAIVSLPAKMLPNTSVSLALWVLRRPSDFQSANIKFIDATEVPDAEKHVAQWLTSGTAAPEAPPHRLVDVRDVLATEVDLTPQRWVDVGGRDPHEVAEAYNKSWKSLNESLDKTRGAAGSLRQLAGTGEARIVTVGDLVSQGLVEVRPGRTSPADLSPSLAARLVTSADIRGNRVVANSDERPVPPKLHSELTEEDDVLVTTVGKIVAMVDRSGGHLLGSGVYRLRVTDRGQLSPFFLAVVLQGAWNSRFQAGTTVPRAGIRHLEVPLVSPEEQRNIALADVAVEALIDNARVLAAKAQWVRGTMLDVLRYNATRTGGIH